MLFAIVTWIILAFQPRFVFLFAIGAAIIALSLPGLFAAQSREEITIRAFELGIDWAVLFLVGALIIVVRKWMDSRASRAEQEADRELARIRAEAAARDATPPPA